MRSNPLTLAFAVVLIVPAMAAAPARTATTEPSYLERFQRAKANRIMQEPAREREERVERARHMLKRLGAPAKTPAAKSAPARAPATGARRLRLPAAGDEVAPKASATHTAAPNRASALQPNHRVNNPAGDTGNAAQSEQSLAADGSNVLCAFNDGQGFNTPGLGEQGYAYSNDGGLNWTDGGVPPSPAGWTWASDPVITLNEKTHDFYYVGLCDSNLAGPGTAWNGIAMARATFPAPAAPTWDTPRLVVESTNTFYFFDKEWMVADSTTGNLYLTYTRYQGVTNGMYFQRSVTQGVTWTNPTQLSGASEAGVVQGSRVVVGPGPIAPVYVTWFSIGPDADFYKTRKSTTQGLAWGTELTAVSAFHAYDSGAPGFNRGNSVDYPGFAVDRSTGPHRGRLYMAWHESVNFYADTAYFAQFTGAGSKVEIEANNDYLHATPFNLGQTLRGSLTPGDQDWFSFSGTQGQTVFFWVDSLDASVENSFRLIATDGVTRLALSDPGAGVGDGGQIVFTLPATGTYFLRPAEAPSLTGSGGYRVETAIHHPVAPPAGGRARDHRDVFVLHSDDGQNWNATPVLVNDDPPWFDNWLPEIAVDANGVAYVAWFDWRDAPVSTCGGVSNVYLARSANGGDVWTSFGSISDAQSPWTTVLTNLAPNQGDYLGLYANDTGVYPAWADGRDADVNVYMVPLTLAYLLTPAEASLVSAEASSDRVDLTWFEGAGRSMARLERSSAGAAWMALATLAPDGTGYLRYTDRAVTAGALYQYRLVISESGVDRVLGAVDVRVPLPSRFALERVWPNPAEREVNVSFSLDSDARATLSLIDVSGRLVRNVEVGSLGVGTHTGTLGGSRLAPGVYLVKLEQAGRTLVRRVAAIR
jgi:hypothetical protein